MSCCVHFEIFEIYLVYFSVKFTQLRHLKTKRPNANLRIHKSDFQVRNVHSCTWQTRGR